MAGSLVTTQSDAFRDDFNGAALRVDADDPTAWEVVQATAGPATVTGSNLLISAGTAAGETIVRSRRSWLGPFRALFVAGIDQRRANQEIELRVCSKDGAEVAGWLFDGTTATTAKTRALNGAAGLADAAVTVTTTATTTMYEINVAPDELRFCSRVPDSATGLAAEAVRHRRIPDPDTSLFVEIRVRNTGTVAGATVLTIDSVLMQDAEELSAELVGGRGGIGAGSSVPVAVTGMPASIGAIALPSANQTALNVTKVNNAAASAGLANIKSTTGRIYGYRFANRGAAWAYVRLYDKATAPIAGDSPKVIIGVPPGGTVSDAMSVPIGFSSGIGIAVTSAPTDTDTTAIAGANEVIGFVEHL